MAANSKYKMSTSLFAAFLPIVLFWLVEKYWGLKAALLVGCIAAIGEIVWEYVKSKRVSFMTWAVNGLVLGLGAISFWMDSGVAFKLQPAVMEFGMAIFMVIMRRKGGDPFMLRTFKEAPMIEAQKRDALLSLKWFRDRLIKFDNYLILMFIFHSIAVVFVAIWGTTDQWVFLTKVLFYVLLVLIALPMYKRPSNAKVT